MADAALRVAVVAAKLTAAQALLLLVIIMGVFGVAVTPTFYGPGFVSSVLGTQQTCCIPRAAPTPLMPPLPVLLVLQACSW
jgi:hypothetical protein